MGVGHGYGENKALDAVQSAIESPLLETKIDGAKAILLYFEGGYDMGMHEIEKVANVIHEKADDDCNIIFGAAINPDLNDEIAVTVIATGFDEGLGEQEAAAPKQEEMKTGLGEDIPKVTEADIFGSVPGLEGQVVDLTEILNEESSESSRFEVPSFLHSEK